MISFFLSCDFLLHYFEEFNNTRMKSTFYCLRVKIRTHKVAFIDFTPIYDVTIGDLLNYIKHVENMTELYQA